MTTSRTKKKNTATAASVPGRPRLSPQDQPLLLHDDKQRPRAGIKLEYVTQTGDGVWISGWCFGLDGVTLLCNGTEVPAAMRRVPRPDVAATYATGTAIDLGFEFMLPTLVPGNYGLRWSGAPGSAMASIELALDVDLHVAPQESLGASQTAAQAAPRIQGHLDCIHDMQFLGWALNTMAPGERLTIDFLLDGEKLGDTVCDLPRKDLRDAAIGDGNYGFAWTCPEGITLRDLSRIRIRLAGSLQFDCNNVKPRFSRPETTGVFAGPLDLCWPYYLSGALTTHDGTEIESVRLVANGQELVSIALEPDTDVRSSDFGAATFFHALPQDWARHFEGSIFLVVNDLAYFQVFNSQTAQRSPVAGGGFDVVANRIEGWIDWRAHDGKPSAPLEIIVNHQRMQGLTLQAESGSRTDFSVPIADAHFAAGTALLIGVRVADAGIALPGPGDTIEIAYEPAAIGHIDKWAPPLVTGWAIDYQARRRRCVVKLYEDETLITQVECQLLREDVNSKFKVSGHHGFEMLLPASLFDDRSHNLRVMCNGVPLRLGSHFEKNETLSREALAALDPKIRFRGRVEQLTTGVVAGWAWDAMRPESPVDLLVKVDGQLVGTTRANQFSTRLRGAGRSGHQEFLFHLPDSLQNGCERTVTVEEMESRYALPNEISPITFPLVALADKAAGAQWNYSAGGADWRSALRYSLYETPRRASAAKLPLISMIVLNWNGDLLLEDFLESLLRVDIRHPYELLIVDHGSSDASTDIIRRYVGRLPIKLIERHANYSFSASNNHAARLASGALLFFINNDLIFQHDCASSMASLLDDPAVGIVGARLLEPIKDKDGWVFQPHHEGVRFKVASLPGSNACYYSPQEIHGVPAEWSKAPLEMPVVTGGLMMCRKSDFEAVGGFCEDYFYGLEDVDYCLKLASRLGKKILCDLSASVLHNRSATRDSKFIEKSASRFYTADIHAANRAAYLRRFGRGLKNKILGSLIESSSFYRKSPLRVTFVVTEADIHTPAGDYFTALELGVWLKKKFGWDIFFTRFDQHSLPNTDVLIVMRHDYHLREIRHANPGLVTVAWVRNWVDHWAARPEFADYNLVFASSQKAIDYLRESTGREAILLPIATNPERFSPDMADKAHASDLVFTGSYHLEARSAAVWLNLKKATYDFAIYGHNWDKYPPLAPYCRGSMRYDLLGKAYASSRLVIDDSHPVTRDWNSLNSRIFDAIASGKVVITNCVDGARELFGDLLPTFSTRAELNALVARLLGDDAARESLAQRLRAQVLAKHTYAHRADTIKTALLRFTGEETLRFAIKIGVPRLEEREQWGDYHFAQGIKRALEKQGHFARIDILPHWDGGLQASDDVVLVLRGLSRYRPQPNVINLMWLISHPDEVSLAEMREYDHVFVASSLHAQRLGEQLGDAVSPLLQCTDPALFFREVDESLAIADVLFVGNSRGQRREVVQAALESGVDFGVFGSGWTGMLPSSRLHGEYIPNTELRRYYSTAKVVLNDHWPDMRASGFISNRIFDAAACGAVILSDAMAGMTELTGESVLQYDDPSQFAGCLDRALSGRTAKAAKARQKTSENIRRNHTFDSRAADILRTVAQLRKT